MPTKRTTQTTRINGARVKIVTSASGKVTVKPALPLEWELQAAQVRALRALPDYGKRFLLASGMEAGKRGAIVYSQAIAAGMTPGNPDLTIYLPGGRVGLIENKVGKAKMEDSQARRHPELEAIGHPVTVVRSVSEEEAAAKAVELVQSWLAAQYIEKAA